MLDTVVVAPTTAVLLRMVHIIPACRVWGFANFLLPIVRCNQRPTERNLLLRQNSAKKCAPSLSEGPILYYMI